MSVEKRGERYYVRIYKGGSKSFDTKKEALAYQAQIVNFRNNNPSSQVSNKTLFTEVANKFLERTERTKEYNTYKSYESKYRIWIKPELESWQIGNINQLTIINFHENIRARRIGDSTFDLVNIVLFEILNFATNRHQRYIMENPMIKPETKQAVKKPLSHLDYWSTDEAECFLSFAKKSPYYDSFVFILNTGLRFNEFACIKKDSFDLNAGTLNVHEQICARNKDGSSFYIKKTKGKEYRSVPLNPVPKKIAKRLTESSDTLFLFCPGGTEEKNILTRKGSRAQVASHKIITNRTFAYAIKASCKAANVKYIGPHGLRHTFAATFLMNGGNIFVLSRILGHKSINTTLNEYGHLSMEFLASSASIVSFGESK